MSRYERLARVLEAILGRFFHYREFLKEHILLPTRIRKFSFQQLSFHAEFAFEFFNLDREFLTLQKQF